MSGGAPVPPTLKRALRDEWKLPLAESYGQSELGGFMALGDPVLMSEEKFGAAGPSARRTIPNCGTKPEDPCVFC